MHTFSFELQQNILTINNIPIMLAYTITHVTHSRLTQLSHFITTQLLHILQEAKQPIVALHRSNDIISREKDTKARKRSLTTRVDLHCTHACACKDLSKWRTEDSQDCKILAICFKTSEIYNKSFKCWNVQHQALQNECQRRSNIMYLQRLRGNTHTDTHTHTNRLL